MNTLNHKLALRLRNAYQKGAIAPLRSHFDGEPSTHLAAAYKIQHINTQYWLAQERRIVGRKIGLTSPAVQRQLGVDQPDMGVLFADTALLNGAEVPIANFLQPKIEAEIALVLNKALKQPQMTIAEIIAAVDFVLPAIELVDSRVSNWDISILDTVADNASSAAFVLGDRPYKLADLDLRLCGMQLTSQGELLSSGAGLACLGHPLHAALWLANEMVRQETPLQAGDLVLTGALGPMVVPEAGRVYQAQISGLGAVRLAFV